METKKPSPMPEEYSAPVFEWCAQSLEHASHCSSEAKCKFYSCLQMKRAVAHKEGCSLLTLHYNIEKGEWCNFCKKLNVITRWHAKRCDDQGCRVPLCNFIKKKRGEPQFRTLFLEEQMEQEEDAMVSIKVDQEKGDDPCIICKDNMKIARVEPCGHSDFCLQCLLKWQKNPQTEKSCPLCRVPIKGIVPSKFSIPSPRDSACSKWHQRGHK